jgi:hypothetical protein
MAPAMEEKWHVSKEVSLRYVRTSKKGGSDTAGVLCYDGAQSSLCSVPATHLCQGGGPGGGDPGPSEPFGPRRGVLPHETLSLAQEAEAYLWPGRGGGAHLGLPPCRGALWQEAAGSHAGVPACPGENRHAAPLCPACRTPLCELCHHGRSPAGGEGEGKGPEASPEDQARESPRSHPGPLLPGTLGSLSRLRGGGPREP